MPLDEFYGSLADRVFHSTQYIRHPAAPLYTPEPDLIHEVIGHGNLLASPEFAELNLLAGQAARRCETERRASKFLADVFWFTIEFGVLHEDGELRAYGAGILSSYGEIEEFREMEIRPIDYLEMGTIDYDITHYQPVLYARRVDDPPDGVARRLLRRLRRRHAGPVLGALGGRSSLDTSGVSEPAFLFADLSGYTALTEVHGDEEAADLVLAFADEVRAILPGYGAEQVKTIGDALMIRADDPERAVRLGDRDRPRRGPAPRLPERAGGRARRSRGGARRRLVRRHGEPGGPRVGRGRGRRGAAHGGHGRAHHGRARLAAAVPPVARAARVPERGRSGRAGRGHLRVLAWPGRPAGRSRLPNGGGPRHAAGSLTPRGSGVLVLLARLRAQVRRGGATAPAASPGSPS